MAYHGVHIWLTFCFRSTLYGVSWCTHLVDFLFQKRRIMVYTFNWLFVSEAPYMVHHGVHIWLTFCFRSTVHGVSWCTHLVDFLLQKHRIWCIMVYSFG